MSSRGASSVMCTVMVAAFVASLLLRPTNATLQRPVFNNSGIASVDVQQSLWRRGSFMLVSDTGPSGPDTRVWPKLELNPRIVIATILGFLGGALANGAGVGGGPLFVPLFNLLIGFDAKTSAALSKAMIAGGSIACLLFYIKLRHPLDPNKSIIDFGIASLLQPTLLLGISIGVTCNVMFPAWLLKLLLCTLLFLMTRKTIQKGISTWKQEAQLAARETNVVSKLPSNGSLEESPAQGTDNVLHEPIPAWKLIKWKYISQLSLIWVVYFTVQLVKVKVPSCGIAFWILDLSQVPVSLLASFWAAKSLLAEFKIQDLEQPLIDSAAGPESRHWSNRQVYFAPLFSLLAGIMGGLLGIGGGIIMSPTLLEFGLHPQVSSATSSFMVLFSSTMSVVEFYLLGRIPIETARFFFGVCFVAALTGLSVVRSLVVWSKKTSIIVFVLATFMGISAVVILVIGGHKSYTEWVAGENMGFSNLCDG